MRSLLFLLLFLLPASSVLAFGQDGCGAGECRSCHSMTIDEARTIFAQADKVHSVDFSEVPGLYVVEVESKGKKAPYYVDFSKHYVVAGNIFSLADGRNISVEKTPRVAQEQTVKFADLARIPLADALLLGKEDARWKIIVFTDPDCPWCKKLHTELTQVVASDPQIAFLIKLFPLPMHKDAYAKSKSIVCARSLELLEASFAGKNVVAPPCETDAVDQTIAVAKDIGVTGTPALIFPDGRILPGYREAASIIAIVRELEEKTAPQK